MCIKLKHYLTANILILLINSILYLIGGTVCSVIIIMPLWLSTLIYLAICGIVFNILFLIEKKQVKQCKIRLNQTARYVILAILILLAFFTIAYLIEITIECSNDIELKGEAKYSFWGSYIGAILTFVSILIAFIMNKISINNTNTLAEKNAVKIEQSKTTSWFERYKYVLSPPIVGTKNEAFNTCYNDYFSDFYRKFEKLYIEYKSIKPLTQYTSSYEICTEAFVILEEIKDEIENHFASNISTISFNAEFIEQLLTEKRERITEIYSKYINSLK